MSSVGGKRNASAAAPYPSVDHKTRTGLGKVVERLGVDCTCQDTRPVIEQVKVKLADTDPSA